jgi:2-polyprenyl-6-methoxyphenol hydroxylase-like FAD-dependent oxidoreductase
MRILIVGAGIAGLTLAYWLEKSGHEAIIVEKSATIRTTGYMLDFAGTGWDVADRMGLIPAIRQRALPSDSVIYKDANDKISAKIPVKAILASTDAEPKYAALNRRDLVLTLYEAVKDRVEICFGKSIKTIRQDASTVTAGFDDGTSDTYDLLVGCDGIHSHTRELVFGEEKQFAHYLGYQFALFEMPPLPHDLGHSYHMHVEPQSQLGVYPTADDNWLFFAAFAHENDSIPAPNQRVAALRKKLAHLKWYAPEILERLPDDAFVFWDNVTQIEMPRWYDNRVGLIGDAAHCPTLVSGQGASMAMAGAYFLADALTKTDSYTEAFQMVAVRLRPHIEKIQKAARSFAPTFIPKSRLRIMLINLILRFSNFGPFRGIIGKQFVLESIL